ncbi:hypothetical protein FPF71_02440 [Algibacter amylolyticus]|uniref:DUF3887 domain-containing protein n=1 Tax=Algibacter amylolyticus TaxID=1608400 RepID=A0A5M7BH66_9FLAO|nr:hypothetical protein [Algibacter amylolyticus]KAA5827717.1 hypothetical protein F2B50_02440 [Algibacter amylolyticus]MBB5266937.1 hypothetical protein [Algibacter amylolyticus]TSJ81962.1 hypothetical protein FPF71_02440 [Algibacter amylolyticus]
MKNLIFIGLLIISLLTSCQNKTKAQEEVSVSASEEQVDYVENLSDRILKAQKAGGFYKLTESEASIRMVTGLNETLQKSTYAKIKGLLGDYKDLEFYSLEEIKKDQVIKYIGLEVILNWVLMLKYVRFLDSEGKLAGFFVKPWKDKL